MRWFAIEHKDLWGVIDMAVDQLGHSGRAVREVRKFRDVAREKADSIYRLGLANAKLPDGRIRQEIVEEDDAYLNAYTEYGIAKEAYNSAVFAFADEITRYTEFAEAEDAKRWSKILEANRASDEGGFCCDACEGNSNTLAIQAIKAVAVALCAICKVDEARAAMSNNIDSQVK